MNKKKVRYGKKWNNACDKKRSTPALRADDRTVQEANKIVTQVGVVTKMMIYAPEKHDLNEILIVGNKERMAIVHPKRHDDDGLCFGTNTSPVLKNARGVRSLLDSSAGAHEAIYRMHLLVQWASTKKADSSREIMSGVMDYINVQLNAATRGQFYMDKDGKSETTYNKNPLIKLIDEAISSDLHFETRNMAIFGPSLLMVLDQDTPKYKVIKGIMEGQTRFFQENGGAPAVNTTALIAQWESAQMDDPSVVSRIKNAKQMEDEQIQKIFGKHTSHHMPDAKVIHRVIMKADAIPSAISSAPSKQTMAWHPDK